MHSLPKASYDNVKVIFEKIITRQYETISFDLPKNLIIL